MFHQLHVFNDIATTEVNVPSSDLAQVHSVYNRNRTDNNSCVNDCINKSHYSTDQLHCIAYKVHKTRNTV